MADAPPIKVDAVKRRMDAGEDFTFIGVRKFETLRLVENSEGQTDSCVLHLTERRV
jgi:hypothetical protein